MDNFSELFTFSEPTPIELLDMAMKQMEYGWEDRCVDECFDLEHYTGLVAEEVRSEIESIWLPIFRNKKNLEFAFEALITTSTGSISADFCQFYLDVIRGKYEDK